MDCCIKSCFGFHIIVRSGCKFRVFIFGRVLGKDVVNKEIVNDDAIDDVECCE